MPDRSGENYYDLPIAQEQGEYVFIGIPDL